MKPIYTVTLVAVLLASLSVLQAAESHAPLPNPERMPAFSWDSVPLYVHIRKDTAFTNEEIKHLATFPLITFEKATGHTDSGSVEAGTLKAARAVKAVNPESKILYYRNVIVHYGGYASNASLEDIPEPFLVGRNGNDKLIRNRVQAYDLSNKALRDWWIDAVEDVCCDPSIDGVFMDGVFKVLEPAFLKRYHWSGGQSR
ncbi:putative glycoside hydrolase [Planctomycetota bacterium]